MKKILVAILSVVLIIVLTNFALLLRQPKSILKKRVIRIAIPGPISTENGQEMLRGAELYLDKINKQNKFEHTKIELFVFDDRDKRTAISIADKIANENKMLLILGHYDSAGSRAAGMIYRNRGIPAITASATSEAVTFENEWYFRIISGNRLIADFIVDYIRKVMDVKRVSILHDTDEYGSSLARRFESNIHEAGIHIKKKWEIDTWKKNPELQLKRIVGSLKSERNLGMIFCATHKSEAVEFSVSLRYPGTDYPVIGPDPLSTPSFINLFNHYPRERISPGYYSDGIYAVSHFFSDTAGKKGHAFRRDFIQKYGREPSWIAACYYDAMHVALSAVERAEITGQDIIEDRRRVREALSRFDHPDVAIKGITGNIYFDKHGNAAKPLYMGIWHNQTFLPAFRQYREPQPEESADVIRKQDGKQDANQPEKDQMTIGGRALSETRIVYTGIDINEIYNLNIDKGVFTADFYLWFRFQGEFDDSDIIFTNAVNPVKLDDPFMEYTAGKDSIRSYRVIADFEANFDVQTYPFDRQTLRINLRHAEYPEIKLIYVPDLFGFPQASPVVSFQGKATEKNMFKPIAGWNITDISFYQDIVKISDKKTDSYSLFSTEIQIGRKYIKSIFIKTFFPAIMAIFILYVVYLMPPDRLDIRTLILVLSVTAGAAHYLHMNPGHKLTGYAFIIVHILAGISALLSALIYLMNRQGLVGGARLLTLTGKCIHISVIITAGIFLIYRYGSALGG